MLVCPAILVLAAALPLDTALAGRPGVIVVADVRTGRILARRGIEHSAAPGSTVKPFLAQALLASGRQFDLPCPGKKRIAGRRLDCSHPPVAGPLDLETALAYSCNHYFMEAARRLGPDAVARALAPFAPRRARNAEELALQGIGEWGVSATPVELARAYRKLALGCGGGPVCRGLAGAVNYGTAQLAGMGIAGKTGTTPHPKRLSTHAWFAGWSPVQAPQVLVVVFLENGKGGPDAAPVARAVFEAWSRGR
ncbi:MAG: hypothetical protein HYZ57_16910 [Acidobacteria bacterium]|nr:hypothetical protein [Acidobacteriota bacterium]